MVLQARITVHFDVYLMKGKPFAQRPFQSWPGEIAMLDMDLPTSRGLHLLYVAILAYRPYFIYRTWEQKANFIWRNLASCWDYDQIFNAAFKDDEPACVDRAYFPIRWRASLCIDVHREAFIICAFYARTVG